MKEIVAEKVEGGELEILEEIEIEVYAKRGQQQPPAKSYKIRIDKEIKVVHVPSMTGREILGLVGKTPEAYRLYEHIHGKQPQPVDANQPVDFTAPGVERFTTMPRDPTEGRATAPLTRHFQLPEGDEDYLDRMGVDWETVIEDQKRWLIIHEFHIPPGYKISLVKLALLIHPAYPDDQIDMMWFFPAVAREDGRSIGGLSSQIIQSQTYQRWSRHRTGSNPWRPGVDDISSHLTLVDECLRREFSKS